MKFHTILGGGASIALAMAAPAYAQDVDDPGAASTPLPEETVFDGDYLTVGIGAGYAPSYTGSDDYVVFPFPAVQGSIGGIDISPRAAGVAVDFIPDRAGPGANFSLGVAAKLNRDRANRIKDPVVASLGELDTAVEVGPTAGVSFSQVLNPYDSLSFTVDATWDVAGAHKGMAVTPGVTYFTPVSRAAAVSLSIGGKFIDDDYADYYYTVTPAQSVTTGGVLPAYKADGGFESLGANLFAGYDLNGDLTDGGFALFGVAGYSRLFGDAKRTPFTSVRGSADQWLVGLGVGYTF
ncbi:MipA/OmpV family protein [Erythrobacter sp. 3-20A1M]|uniref:MipA/OmpV family protein n=1 Tax=Erythrobacter sp. 3-20A1M TaxID=2653850 RepID=UPI00203F34A4|nr:MipA/OmpV family protein [Erythrobacter sp. 3-20A1M]